MKNLVVILLLLVTLGCNKPIDWTCNGNCENGYGIKQWKDGGYIKGHWKDGKIYGQGNEFFGSTSKFAGDTYVGNFNDGYDGYGVYYDKSEDAIHKGQWKNGKPNGYGVSIFGPKADDPYRYYAGQWKNGVYDGFGIFYFSTNDGTAKFKYVGNWKNGNKEGHGIIYFQDGSRYDGNWKNDEWDGNGTYIFKDGSKYNGHWNANYDPNFEGIKKAHAKLVL